MSKKLTVVLCGLNSYGLERDVKERLSANDYEVLSHDSKDLICRDELVFLNSYQFSYDPVHPDGMSDANEYALNMHYENNRKSKKRRNKHNPFPTKRR